MVSFGLAAALILVTYGQSPSIGMDSTIQQIPQVEITPDHAYKYCASENYPNTPETCLCQEGGTIAYGAPSWVKSSDPRLVEKVAPEGGIACSNKIFGDPLPGSSKICWCKKPVVTCGCYANGPENEDFCNQA